MSVSPPQTVFRPNGSPNLLKQLPRKRADRLVWQWPDTVWVLLCMIAACACLWKTVTDTPISPLAYFDSALMSSALYVGGLKASSRFAGVAGALLYATNLPLAELSAWHPIITLEIAFVAVAVGGYLSGIMAIAFAAAAGLSIFGFDGAMIGLSVCLVALAQRKDFALAGLAAFVGALALWSLTVHPPKIPHWIGLSGMGGYESAIASSAIFGRTWWFLAPFAADAFLKATRARWILPGVVVALVLVLSCLSGWKSEPTVLLAVPVVILMISAGFGRLMPTVAGEFPKQVSRYVAATFAVALLLGMQALSAKESWLTQLNPAVQQNAPLSK